MKRRLAIAAALLATVAALAVAFSREREQAILFEDERQFLAAATSLAATGGFSSVTVEGSGRSRGVLREPGYPVFVAALWRAAGAAPPASAAELDAAPSTPSLHRPVRLAQGALLAIAAAASGWAVTRLRGRLAGAIAAALVAASATLGRAACDFMSEPLAAALVALLSAALVALVTRPSKAMLAAAVAVAALLPLVRAEAVVLLPVVVAFAARERAGIVAKRRWIVPLATALLVALPALLWMARNRAESGHFVLSDRGGLALAVRVALDDDVARFGARVAALSFTPSDAARREAARLEPESTLLDSRAGSDNFLLRTYREFEAERAAPGADPLDVDARRGRAALAAIRSRPGRHLATAAVVAWRGLFAERSPDWSHPFDLALALGILLGASSAVLAVWSVLQRDAGALALLAPAATLFAFHAAATEFLPRYAIPLLPSAWAALATLGATLLHHRRGLEEEGVS